MESLNRGQGHAPTMLSIWTASALPIDGGYVIVSAQSTLRHARDLRAQTCDVATNW
jgi:hypothetical protein